MKKLLLVLFCVFTALAVSAQYKGYTENLLLTVDGQSVEIPDVTILYQDNGDGTANFLLKNFYLSMGSNNLAVGNISVPNMPITKGDAYDTFNVHEKIIIEDGDADALPEGTDMWLGPMIFSDGLVLDLAGKVNDEKLYVVIYLNLSESGLEGFGQIIEVQFGSDFSEDMENAVSSIASVQKSSAVYDLSGRRVKNPSRGIYVREGKKVLF
ncbi:MAG: hypothetical protein J6W52_03560 [Bacteroidaceae bacterium]|nr:hypothetical protein [Bacteroidaceae bacterium]